MAIHWSRFEAETSDGLRLSIERACPAQGRARGAVVLQHGLGANRLAFTMPEASLAEHLAGHGYDCYIPELRGAGRSASPGRAFTLDEYVTRDIPAILRAVLQSSGASQLDWIGHSMGGILMLMYGIEHHDAPVSRIVTIGSGLDYTRCPNVYQQLRHFRPLLAPLTTLPFGFISRLVGSVAGVGPTLLPERMNFHRPNVERSVCRRLMTEGFSPIPIALFDSLATTFTRNGFSRDSGRIVYLPRAGELRRPTLVIAGTRDEQCPPDMARDTFERIGSPVKQLRIFGKAYGHAEDYGHFDLLVGRNAPTEVWPEIATFLERKQLRTAVTAQSL